MQNEILTHPFPPVCGSGARVLILGSFPSVKSREIGFYYGHPQNRFWRVIAAVTGEELPVTKEQKIALLNKHGVALWDSIASCSIEGSADACITHAVPNDVGALLNGSNIKAVFCNGKTSYDCYTKYVLPETRIPAVRLPSTSAANAAWSLDRLIDAWRVIMDQHLYIFPEG